MPKKNKQAANRGRSAQMMAPAPRKPEQLLDGKTFVFVEYIPISTNCISNDTTQIYFNAGVNGWYYQTTVGTSTITTDKAYWGTTLNQFTNLSLLYETYTVMSVEIEVVPSFPSIAYCATAGIVATQTAESVNVFLAPTSLASQVNAALATPLGVARRRLDYQYYLQQNVASPYVNTYDSSTLERQLFDSTTGQPSLPIMSFVYDIYGLFGAIGIPVMLIKSTTRVHFRGRQNEFFTPSSYAMRLLNGVPQQHSDSTKVESSLTASEKTRVDHVVVSRDESISAVKQLLARLQRDDGGSSG